MGDVDSAEPQSEAAQDDASESTDEPRTVHQPDGGREMTELVFTVFGVPQPKGSAKAFVPKGWTRAIVTSDNPKHKGWQQLVAEAASRALQDTTDTGVMFDGPVELRVVFFLPRPKSLKKGVTAHLKKPDLDKLCRSVKDALNRVVWRDDSQVVALLARKVYAAPPDSPRADILVARVS